MRTRTGRLTVAGSRPELLQNLVSGEARQHPVQDHQVRKLPTDGIERLRPATGSLDAEALTSELVGDQSRDVRLVLYHQDPRERRSDLEAEFMISGTGELMSRPSVTTSGLTYPRDTSLRQPPGSGKHVAQRLSPQEGTVSVWPLESISFKLLAFAAFR